MRHTRLQLASHTAAALVAHGCRCGHCKGMVAPVKAVATQLKKGGIVVMAIDGQVPGPSQPSP